MQRFLPKSNGVWWTAIVGLIGVVIGVIYGIVLMTRSGTPSDCYGGGCTTHPDLGAGLTVIALSITLASVIVLASYVITLLETIRTEQLIEAKRQRTSA